MKTLDIVLTLTTPLHVAYPGNADKENGANISRTTKLPLFVNGRIQYVPCYPANGFRGALRRKAMSRLVAHFKTNEGPIPGDLYLGLSCGASSGSPDNSPLSIEEILRARDNVYMGLFGGGARLHASAYRVSDMLPIIDDTVATGSVPGFCREYVKAKPAREGDCAPEYAKPWELIGKRTSIRVDDLFRVLNPLEITSVVANPLGAVASHQAGVLDNREGRKNDADEGKSDVANMMGIETVAAGVPFHFRLDLDQSVDDAKLGMVLLGLNDLFKENAFGGWTRCGFGKVRVEAIRIHDENELLQWEQLHDDQGVFTLPAAAAQFTDAANDAIRSLKIADMAGFFEDFSAESKKIKKAATKAKKAPNEAAAA